MIGENFSRHLKRYRLLNNLTQEELAKKLGVTQKSILHWEKGRSAPRLNKLSKIANELGIKLEQLLES